MAVLNSWQRFDRPGLFGGQPWGTGASGSATVSSDPNTRATVTGTATQSTSTIGSAILSNGDAVILHQTQGTGAGQWECQKVASGGGTTSITWATALKYTYATGAQVIKVPMYTTASVSAFTPTAWSGTTGGVVVIAGKVSITVTGALAGTGKGYRGGAAGSDAGGSGNGESNSGNPGTQVTGAGDGHTNGGYGAGGGYGTEGGDGGGTGGGGGDVHGSADLTVFDLGGGGAGATAGDVQYAGAGGVSGAAFILISDNITLSAAVTANGGAGVTDTDRGGGGGSGSAILFVCRVASLGSNQATATGGATGGGSQGGGGTGTGGVGRIAVHHSGTVTGTTNPTFNDTTDLTLVEMSGGFFTLI